MDVHNPGVLAVPLGQDQQCYSTKTPSLGMRMFCVLKANYINCTRHIKHHLQKDKQQLSESASNS